MGSICWAQVTAKLPCHRTKEQVGGKIQRKKRKTITALLFTMTFLLKYDERRALWDTIDVNGNGYVSFSEVSTVRTPSQKSWLDISTKDILLTFSTKKEKDYLVSGDRWNHGSGWFRLQASSHQSFPEVQSSFKGDREQRQMSNLIDSAYRMVENMVTTISSSASSVFSWQPSDSTSSTSRLLRGMNFVRWEVL